MRLDKNSRSYLPRKWEEEQGFEEGTNLGRAEVRRWRIAPDEPASEGLYQRQGIALRVNP